MVEQSRVHRYLKKSLNLHPNTFKDAFHNIYKLDYFIADNNYYQFNKIMSIQNYLFILTDSYGFFNYEKNCYFDNIDVGTTKFKNNLEIIKQFPFYINHYSFLANTPNQVMIVLELPKKELMNQFLNGQYSKMYNHAEIDELYQPIKASDIGSQLLNETEVVIKDILKGNCSEGAKEYFQSILKEKLGVHQDTYKMSGEMDLPAKSFLKDEVANFNNDFLYWVGLKKESVNNI